MELQSDNNLKPKQNERSYKAFVFCFFIFFLSIAFDQFTKYFVFKKSAGQFLERLRPVAGLQTLKNFQSVFSLPLPVWLIYLLTIAVLIAMTRYITKNYQNFVWREFFAWSLIYAGAISNLVERIFLGYVRDFIYILTGVFNLADICIILGIIILLAVKNHKNQVPSSKQEPISN